MALSPQVAKFLPRKLRLYSEGLRYPYVFLAFVPIFILGMLFSPHIPYPEQVLTVIGMILFAASKLKA
jgi:hypothetical protein